MNQNRLKYHLKGRRKCQLKHLLTFQFLGNSRYSRLRTDYPPAHCIDCIATRAIRRRMETASMQIQPYSNAYRKKIAQ
ncbi:MAG: hypothetical protein OQK68_05435 [Sedimenticola sp.]|nr:hypothetical protein [Sedimenticola sp.]